MSPEIQDIALTRATGLVTELVLTIRNVGNGPAFDIAMICGQGGDELEIVPETCFGASADSLTEPGSNVPTTLAAHGKGTWHGNLRQGPNRFENAAKPLDVTITCTSMFGTRIDQSFRWLPNPKTRVVDSNVLPTCVSIDLGFGEGFGTDWAGRSTPHSC